MARHPWEPCSFSISLSMALKANTEGQGCLHDPSSPMGGDGNEKVPRARRPHVCSVRSVQSHVKQACCVRPFKKAFPGSALIPPGH